MDTALRRRLSAAALVASLALLPGCALVPSLGEITPVATDDAADSSGDSDSPEQPDPDLPPSELTFEAGAELDPAKWSVQWGDAFLADESFSVLSPDDGNGNWSYLDGANQCEISFYQGGMADLDMSQDDRPLTDDFLASVLAGTVTGSTRADVDEHAFDHELKGLGVESVEFRAIWGSAADGGTWLHAGRMFGLHEAALYVGIRCPAGFEADEEFAKLTDSHLSVIVGPRGG